MSYLADPASDAGVADIAFGDLDGDGVEDLVAGSNNSGGNASFSTTIAKAHLVGPTVGTGSFESAVTYQQGNLNMAWGVDFGDIDNDGLVEILAIGLDLHPDLKYLFRAVC